MKFILFVEGYTEDSAARDFIARCLNQYFPERQKIGIKTIRFDGWAHMHRDVEKLAKMHLNGPDRDKIIAVISLLDLYGPTFYPSQCIDVNSRCQWGTDYLQKKVDHLSYRHYFAVHETEAWLLSSPSIFPTEIRKSLEPFKNNPEIVNNDEPPAKLLDRLYHSRLKRPYKKVTDGKNLFPYLQPAAALNACPYLKEMITGMAELVRIYNQES